MCPEINKSDTMGLKESTDWIKSDFFKILILAVESSLCFESIVF